MSIHVLRALGQKLRHERERRGIRLNDVELALEIRAGYLVAIEEGRLDDLPGGVFTIGYVSRYARYLGLAVGNLMHPLEAEVAARDPTFNKRVEVVPLRERRLRPVAVIVGALLFAVLAYSADYMNGFVARPDERAAEAPPAEAVAVPTVATLDHGAPLAAQQSSTPVPIEIAVTPVSLRPELAGVVQAPLPAGRQLGLRNRNSRITLRVHEPTLVTVRGARNRTFIDRDLAPGDTYRVPNRRDLRLTVDDAGAVEIMLDGVSAGFAGDPGVAARGLSLNPQGIIDRQKTR